MNKNLTEEFQTSIKNGIVTGSLKFSNKFVSQIQIYSVVKKWSQEDEGVIYASVRTDGDDFIALDFRYDESVTNTKYKSILYDFLKPLFEVKLGDDYIQAWSISRESVIIK
ncbi:MAG: hypothetical protein M0R03_21885 [Novosphingobium sp.]|nr:hypothetical protein [Novosphingobium sp.]